MGITNGYCTLAQARAQIGITETDDTTDDSTIESVVETVSRAIDRVTGTRFYTTDDDETRYYTGDDGSLFKCPQDIISITTLATDPDGDYDYDYTWSSSTDYWLEPVNAALDGKPYTQIRQHPTGTYSFPTSVKAIKIVGKFGWYVDSARPPEITWICQMLTQRLFKRRDAPFGVAGTTELGEVVMMMRRDPDVIGLLASFMRGLGPS